MCCLLKCSVLLAIIRDTTCVNDWRCAGDKLNLSQARLIEHVVIYDYDAPSATELSLSVDERVWVCFLFSY